METNSGSNNASSKYFTCRGTLNSDALEVFKELSCPQLMEASPRPPKPIEVIIGDVIDPATFCMVQKCELDSIKPMENVLTLEGNFKHALLKFFVLLFVNSCLFRRRQLYWIAQPLSIVFMMLSFLPAF